MSQEDVMTVEQMQSQGYDVTLHVSAEALTEYRKFLTDGGALSHIVFDFAESYLVVADITLHALGVKRITKTLKKQLEEANGNKNGIKAEASE
jgi:hypothetical protein